jgi:hypothetical protein
LFFEGFVDVQRELLGLFGRPRDFWAENDAPAGEASCIDGSRDNGGIRADGQRGRERRGRAEAVEKWRPDTAISGVLIYKNTEDARFTQQGQCALEACLAVKGLNAQAAAVAVHEIVDQFIVEGLIDRAEVRLGNLEDQLGIEFPVSDVIDGKKHGTALGDVLPDGVEVFDVSNTLDFLLGEGWNFYGARNIGSQSGEVLEGERADGCLGHFPAECHAQIFPCEAAVAGQDEPEQSAHRLSQNKTHGKRQESDKPEGEQCQNVNQTICHDGHFI